MIEEPILPQLPDFEEYILQGEPDQRQRAENWQVAIGLQAVDGLHTSEYLQQTARQHIEGKISIKEVQKLIKTYYVSKSVRTLGFLSSHCRGIGPQLELRRETQYHPSHP